jgi:hypothetical protein
VRLAGTGREVLEHPEISELYLGGAVKKAAQLIRSETFSEEGNILI